MSLVLVTCSPLLAGGAKYNMMKWLLLPKLIRLKKNVFSYAVEVDTVDGGVNAFCHDMLYVRSTALHD